VEIRWASKALSDLARLHAFLAPVNESAAVRVLQALTAAPNRLIEHPRIGEKLEEFEPREVRRIVVGKYEMRYEVRDAVVYVLRIWHVREKR
jgi:plasmid stabilization system protein ParE